MGLSMMFKRGSIYMYTKLSGLAACYWLSSSICELGLMPQTTMVSICVEMGDFTSDQKLFDKMPHKNPIAWNLMISGYV